jgi:Tol biopolymer transport system component
MRSLRLVAGLSAVPLTLLGLSVFVPAANAGFPGENGKIVFTRSVSGNSDIYTVAPDGTGEVRLTANAAADDQAAWSSDGTKIAFVSERTGSDEIFVMDGTNVTRITDRPTSFDWMPTWSPDGTEIAFASTGGSQDGIFIVSATGGTATKLTDGTSPAWSPDGTKIAFSYMNTGAGDVSSEIYVIGVDGSGLTRLTTNSREDVDADWSPDGSKLAFSRFDTGGDGLVNMEVWTMNADGSGATKVSGADSAMWPTWSPDGTQIAFQGEPAGGTNWDIYRMPAAGGAWTRITTATAVDGEPDWQATAPAETTNGRIAFTSNRDGNFEIYTMKPGGADQQRLTTNNAAMDDYAAWSPDGDKIAFTSWRNGNAEIYVMDPDGSHQTRLTTNSAYDAEPTWSPDGSQIAFVSDRSGDEDLWVMDADGTGAELLLGADLVDEFSPDWSENGVAFVSDYSGNNDIWVWDAVPGDPATQMTDDAASDYSPSWAPSDPGATFHHILFVRGAPGVGDLWDLTLEAGEIQVTTTAKWEFGTDWSPDGNWLLFSRAAVGDQTTAQVWKKSPEGVETQLTSVSGGNFNPDMQPCPDGACGGTTARHSRSITLGLSGSLTASGQLTADDGFGACAASATVEIQRKIDGAWTMVGSTTTSAQGRYAQAVPDHDGRYRARAPRLVLGSDVCRLAVSSKVQHT